MIDIAAVFGENLSRARRGQGVSQEELSVMASVHRTEISQLERGLRVARVDTLVKLKGSLGVSAEKLLAGLDWAPGDVNRGRFVQRDPEQPASEGNA